MIIRRTLLILASLLAIVLAGGAALLTGGQLSFLINKALPTGWAVTIPDRLETQWESATLPHFALSYQNCALLTADNLTVQWAEPVGISLQKATVDYACLAKLPKSNEQAGENSENLANVLGVIPDGIVAIKALHWLNLPNEMPERLRQLLARPSEIQLAKNQQKLTAYLKQKAVSFSAEFAELNFNGVLNYQPSDDEKHQLNLVARLSDNLAQLPKNLKLNYAWTLPEIIMPEQALQQGKLALAWQENEKQHLQGNLHIQSQTLPEHQLNFPLLFDYQSLAIEQGSMNWDIGNDFTLRGFLTAKATPNSFNLDDLFPIKTAIRLSLLSENDKGKGNIVINSPEGEWLAESLTLPFQIHGNVKQGNFILYSSVPLDLSGYYHDLTLRFLPSALVRITGKERFLDIHDLRFPLAGIRVDKHGIKGRLQAIFHGESPDFNQVELHLDGYANNFKAGQFNLFQDSVEENAIKDQWNWRLWGSSQVKALKNKLTIAGRGNWHQDLVTLTEFNGELGKIRTPNLTIPKLNLTLLEPLSLAYQKWHLNGGVQLEAPEIKLNYGGELVRPTATLSVNGELENLHMKGEVIADKLGPLRLFARRVLNEKSSDLIGRLYWQEQPANVFQPLIPFRSNWVITNGIVKGETAFSANAQKGLIAGGHFSVRNGGASFPSGELKGIQFSLPYQYQNSQFDIGVKKALDVSIDEINVGIPIRNAEMKVQGKYPYNRKSPLFLRQLSFDVLGGKIEIDRFSLPQKQEAYLNLRDIEFEKILQLAQYHQIDLKGKINATLPFWLEGKPCYICGGTFAQADLSRLKFTNELLEAMKKSGYTEQILTYLINDSVIDELFGEIQLDSSGNMQLNSTLRMHLNEHQKAKVNLNYNHKENMFELWKLINYGSQFEQNIEHQLYQKLDKP